MTAGIATLPFEVQSQSLVPTGGVYDFKKAADMLADFGREGDTYIVHAAEGETVIPMEVLQANPRMKTMLFKQMEDMGLEPERYVVGNELNSINPITGKPEFFLKKLFKGLKKVVKKVAPIVLPIVAPYLLPTMPLFLSAGIGSFAGGLAAGQDPMDALKGAVIAGGLAGIGSAAFGKGFGATGAESGLTTDYNILGGSTGTGSPTLASSNASNPFLTEGGVKGLQVSDPGKFVKGPIPTVGAEPYAAVGTDSLVPAGGISTQPNVLPKGGTFGFNQPAPTKLVNDLYSPITAKSVPLPEAFQYNPNMPPPSGLPSGTKSFTETIKAMNAPAPPREGIMGAYDKYIKDPYQKFLSPSRPSMSPDMEEVLKQYNEKVSKLPANINTGANRSAIYKDLIKQNTPGAIRKYAPLTTAGTALAYGLGAFDEPEEEPMIDPITGKILLDEDIASGTYKYAFDPSIFYGDNPYYAAGGGEISGPGTPTSDSIPAMLSDGEFVMNAKAVRGAGGGDRKAGAKKMYAMMRNFEKGAA
jgi:hypothetical protein